MYAHAQPWPNFIFDRFSPQQACVQGHWMAQMKQTNLIYLVLCVWCSAVTGDLIPIPLSTIGEMQPTRNPWNDHGRLPQNLWYLHLHLGHLAFSFYPKRLTISTFVMQYNTIGTIQCSVQWWPEGGGWLCSVEVDSEQVSLEYPHGNSPISVI
jgi:hypothetical protein